MSEGSQTKKQNLDLALIGNSCAAAFVDRNARIVWWCFPHFDSDPVFSRLLAGDEEKGFCDVTLANLVETDSRYMRNTAIVETILTDANGGKVRVADFAPNFERFERVYRPPQIIRRIEPVAGLPRVTIRVRPTHNYGRPTTNFVVGSNHIRYLDGAQVLRLTSDAPLSYIVKEISFPLSRPVNLIFGQDDPFLSAIDTTSREFLDRTRDYWHAWVRYLALAYEWQVEVVRAAITLKLCSFAETGAIVAAHTTSIPEAPSSSRTWDYRYCWLRDAYFVVDALNRLGATQIMESYINYITTIASVDDGDTAAARHRAVFAAGGTDRARSQGFSRPGSGSGREPRGDPDAERRLWQRRPRRDADVRGRASAQDGGRGAVPASRRSWRTGHRACLHARRGSVGISHPRPTPHLFGDAVLGGLRSARRHCAPAQDRRSGQILGDATRARCGSEFSRKAGMRDAAR